MQVEITPRGTWWAVHSEGGKYWPADAEEREQTLKDWDKEVGDRTQEIVVIGLHMDNDAVRAAMEACLLTDKEMKLGPDAWAKLDDPWPEWEADEDEDDEVPDRVTMDEVKRMKRARKA